MQGYCILNRQKHNQSGHQRSLLEGAVENWTKRLDRRAILLHAGTGDVLVNWDVTVGFSSIWYVMVTVFRRQKLGYALATVITQRHPYSLSPAYSRYKQNLYIRIWKQNSGTCIANWQHSYMDFTLIISLGASRFRGSSSPWRPRTISVSRMQMPKLLLNMKVAYSNLAYIFNRASFLFTLLYSARSVPSTTYKDN